MQLSVARLCLDCQEIHEADRCPVCTSEAFGFITRWVKIDAPPTRVSPHEKSAGQTSVVDTYREILNPAPRTRTATWLRKGGLVVAAGYLARWGWLIATQHTRSPERKPEEAPQETERSAVRDSSPARSQPSRAARSVRSVDS